MPRIVAVRSVSARCASLMRRKPKVGSGR
jgi:hypothetical protein